MTPAPSDNILDPVNFKRVLSRNVFLPLGLGVLGAVLFIGLIYYVFNTMRWVQHSAQVIAEAREVAQLSVEMESGMRGFLNTGSDTTLEPFNAAAARIDQKMAGVIKLTADNPEQSGKFIAIRELQGRWLGYATELIDKKRQGVSLQELLAIGKARNTRSAVRDELEAFFAEEERLNRLRNDTATTNVPVVAGIFLIFTLGISLLLAFFSRRELTRLSHAYADALAQAEARADSVLAQTWLAEGQRQLAQSVMGKLEAGVLGANALEFFSRYLGSVVGAFYVLNDNAILERKAAWGLAEAGMPLAAQSFAAHDSVVAEVAHNRRQIRLDPVPAGYLRVSSGLGQGSPACVLVSPVFSENEITGVLELGFLRPLQERDAELLQMAGSALGAAMEAARYRERLQHALDETQQLNEELQSQQEELQVQQEELRTANEELEEQSGALKLSQANLEGQQVELEQVNTRLAEQRDALDDRNAELKAAQDNLQERALDLERASRYKSEFLANMSHELRTPLNSSLILAKLLADNPQGNLSDEQVRFAQSIHSAGNDLLNLINDILDISKVEAGKLDIHAEITSVASLAESLRNTFTPLAAAKHLQFDLQLAPELPRTFFTDRQRAEQVLKNLLSNAVKFTDRGTVSLAVSRRGDDALAFDVKDSGIGIEPSQQALVFEAFRQADGTTSRRYGGTGLGLSISRDLATLLGGTISVQSQLGAGSTFTLVLPLRLPDEPAVAAHAASAQAAQLAPAPATIHAAEPHGQPPAPRPPPVADDRNATRRTGQRSVLVVEDEPDFAGILRDLAHERGYICLVAQHADEAIEMAQQFAPDALLLDMRLPGESGLTVLQRLKDNPRTRHIPVHVISGEDLTQAAMQMGAIGYVLKPTTREQLLDVFARVEAKLAQQVKRVLLVEDDARQRESMSLLIRDDGIEIVAVETGGEALALLRTNIFDCMVIDLKLPDMGGNDLLRRMAENDIQSFPPVVVYTGHNLSREEEAELQRYSRSIIIKGARSPERLLDEVTLFLHKVETDLSSEHQNMLRSARNRDKLLEGRRILLVDDDVRNIFALTSALEGRGAHVETARDGQEALDKLAQVQDIDLVLMDIMMPGMDGYTAMREIRKNRLWRQLPIIAVTAKAMKDDQQRCLAAGASDYLAKPIELERLFSLIRVWMPKVERL